MQNSKSKTIKRKSPAKSAALSKQANSKNSQETSVSSNNKLRSSQKPQRESQEEQKKSSGRPSKPLDKLLLTMFDYNTTTKKYSCKFCPISANNYQKRYLYSHLLTDKHRLHVRKPEDIQKLNESLAFFEEKKKQKVSDDSKVHYLEFLAFCFKI